MPETGSYNKIKDMASTHSCKDHPRATLRGLWFADDSWVIWCDGDTGEGHYPELEELSSNLSRVWMPDLGWAIH